MEKRKFYPNIRAEIARLDLSVSDLAQYMGMTTQNVYNKLNGKTALNQKDMTNIQEYFKVKKGAQFTLDYLFEE